MLKNGALSLLSTYGTDSSDDDTVPGPRVSTKRTRKSEENHLEESRPKKFTRLPVPASLLLSKTSQIDYFEDPTLHGGRIRTFAHERGNWATFVYIPFEQDSINKFFTTITNMAPKHIELVRGDNLHISLTKTVILKHHWIQPFIESVKLRITHCKKFLILFNNLKIYCNDERSRTFIGLQIRTGYDSLMKLVEILDKCLEEFSLSPFYKDPSFHMSIAWCVGDHEEELTKVLPQLNQMFYELLDSYSQDECHIYVENLICRTGNKYFKFFLT